MSKKLMADPMYNAWLNMKARCKGRHHGAESYPERGITVASEWEYNFKQFESDMRSSYLPGLTLERIDNTKGYSRVNCRWATRAEQQRNRRDTVLSYGEVDRVRDLARAGLRTKTISCYLFEGGGYQAIYDIAVRGRTRGSIPHE